MNESQSDNIAQPAGGSDNGPSAQARESGWLARLKASLGLVSDRSLRASLETALEQPERLSTAFSPEERLMLLNILGFRELRVEDVMVPRADIIACEENVLISDLMKLFHTAGHSRIPVYRETLDDPRGNGQHCDLSAPWGRRDLLRPRIPGVTDGPIASRTAGGHGGAAAWADSGGACRWIRRLVLRQDRRAAARRGGDGRDRAYRLPRLLAHRPERIQLVRKCVAAGAAQPHGNAVPDGAAGGVLVRR